MQSSRQSSIPFSQDPELGLLGQCSSASTEPLGDKKVDAKKMAGRKQDKRCVILFTFGVFVCFLVAFMLYVSSTESGQHLSRHLRREAQQQAEILERRERERRAGPLLGQTEMWAATSRTRASLLQNFDPQNKSMESIFRDLHPKNSAEAMLPQLDCHARLVAGRKSFCWRSSKRGPSEEDVYDFEQAFLRILHHRPQENTEDVEADRDTLLRILGTIAGLPGRDPEYVENIRRVILDEVTKMVACYSKQGCGRDDKVGASPSAPRKDESVTQEGEQGVHGATNSNAVQKKERTSRCFQLPGWLRDLFERSAVEENTEIECSCAPDTATAQTVLLEKQEQNFQSKPPQRVPLQACGPWSRDGAHRRRKLQQSHADKEHQQRSRV